jgi:hypothetical protein
MQKFQPLCGLGQLYSSYVGIMSVSAPSGGTVPPAAMTEQQASNAAQNILSILRVTDLGHTSCRKVGLIR